MRGAAAGAARPLRLFRHGDGLTEELAKIVRLPATHLGMWRTGTGYESSIQTPR